MFFNIFSELCKKSGVSPNKACIDCEISRTSVAKWKKGATPNGATVAKIADYFGVTTDFLLTGEQTEKAPSPIPGAERIDVSKYHDIPILGRIPAGLPLYAEQNIEGYTLTDLNGGAEYFALRVSGDSMNAIGINDGYLIIVRRQDEVENGEVAVVMVGDDDATVKRFYATNNTVTLMPQSTNPQHTPQIYDTKKTKIKILGKVVKVEFIL